jgi:hypothetical protein
VRGDERDRGKRAQAFQRELERAQRGFRTQTGKELTLAQALALAGLSSSQADGSGGALSQRERRSRNDDERIGRSGLPHFSMGL